MHERNNYYVYGQYLKETNQLFYIGKGTGRRALSNKKDDRSQRWKDFVGDRSIYSVILFSNLTEKKALETEAHLISIASVDLVNTKKSSLVLKIDVDKFLNLYELSETSPSGLTWRNGGGRGISFHRPGDVAGAEMDGACDSRYWTVFLEGKRYLAHRVVYSIVNGLIPDGLFIDHIDGNTSNNRIDNLRAVSPKINCRNKDGSTTKSKTGLRGISVRKGVWNGSKTKKHSYAIARYTDLNGKSVIKMFNFNKFESENEAITAANEYLIGIITELRLSGDDHYTDRHFNFNKIGEIN